jgi:hypothetical protein
MEESQQQVIKVTLSTGRIVLLRPMKIKDQNLAISACKDAGDNNALLASRMQQELLKLLVVQIDGQAPDRRRLEDLDSYFEFSEYMELCQVMGKVMGAVDAGKSQTETVFIGKS